VKYLNCRLQRAMGVCKRRDKVARSVIANDRDGATSGGWDGRQLTGQIDPTRALRVRAWERLFMPPFLPLAAVSWVVSFQEGDKPTFGVAAGAKLSLAIPHGHGSTEPCKGHQLRTARSF